MLQGQLGHPSMKRLEVLQVSIQFGRRSGKEANASQMERWTSGVAGWSALATDVAANEAQLILAPISCSSFQCFIPES